MKIVVLDKDCKPFYSYENDGAMNCMAREDCKWDYNGNVFSCIIPLGFKIAVPIDYVVLFFSRSGMGFNNLTTLVNSVGVIDSGFTNECKVKLVSFNSSSFPPEIKKGDKVCQMILVYRPKIYLEEVDELPETERGLNGIGSTGN